MVYDKIPLRFSHQSLILIWRSMCNCWGICITISSLGCLSEVLHAVKLPFISLFGFTPKLLNWIKGVTIYWPAYICFSSHPWCASHHLVYLDACLGALSYLTTLKCELDEWMEIRPFTIWCFKTQNVIRNSFLRHF